MKNLITHLFTNKGTLIIVVICLSLLGNKTYATQFRSSSTGLWNENTTWETYNGTTWVAAPVNIIPGIDDEVEIIEGHIVTVPANSEYDVTKLNITAASNASIKKRTILDLNGSILNVYGDLTMHGGSNDHMQSELILGTDGALNYAGSFLKTGTVANIFHPASGINKNLISPLPVELMSFTAMKKNAEVALTWETASEKNNTGFEVQASADGKNYEAIGFVASKNGNASNSQRYAFTHKTANQEGLVYYRLKQVDMNGDFEYYTAKVVDLGRIAATVNTFPNPFQNSFELNLSAPATATADILVVDMTGKTVYTAKQELTKGANTIKVELNNQPAGIYLLKAAAGNQTYTNRLVKQ